MRCHFKFTNYMLKSISEIKHLKRARNAEHYWLQEELLKAIPAEFATKYQLSALRAAYSDAFEKEDSVYLQTRGFADTKVLAEKDGERDRLFRLIKLTIRGKELSLNASEAEAAGKLAFIMKPYLGTPSKADAENTALVSDLVKKFESSEFSGYVETLGLTEAVSKLRTANTEFATLYSHRADEKRVKAATETLKAVRKQVDDALVDLVNAINVFYSANALSEKDATKEAEIGAVIDAANAIILQFSETLSRRGIGKKAAISQSETPSTDGEGSASSESDTSGDNTPEQGTDADGNPTFE